MSEERAPYIVAKNVKPIGYLEFAARWTHEAFMNPAQGQPIPDRWKRHCRITRTESGYEVECPEDADGRD
jgi:hypothetical protein